MKGAGFDIKSWWGRER